MNIHGVTIVFLLNSTMNHDSSAYWNRSVFKDRYFNDTINKIRTHLSTKNRSDYPSEYVNTLNKLRSMLSKYSLKKDLLKSFNIVNEQSELLNHVFSSSDIGQLARTLSITEEQAKFVLRSVRARIDNILPDEKDE